MNETKNQKTKPDTSAVSNRVQHSVRRRVGPFSEKAVRSAFIDFIITHLKSADSSMVDGFIRTCERCQNNSTYCD